MARIAVDLRLTKTLIDVISDILISAGHEVLLESEDDNQSLEDCDVLIIDAWHVWDDGLSSPIKFPKMIVMDSSVGDQSTIRELIEDGLWDYILKPVCSGDEFVPETLEKMKTRLLHSIEAAVSVNLQEHKIEELSRQEIIGESQELKSCLARLMYANQADQSLLLSGETGVGKELFAKAAHQNSSRANGPFVSFNCAAIPDSLAEGLLFGSKKGAFTGSDKDLRGLILEAHKGTLFLDEVADLSIKNQASLLRFLQEREILPLGASKPIKVDVRLISAANKNIMKLIEEKKLRKDLYYRLAAFTIEIPPLKKRRADIQLIVDHYIEKICRERGIHPKKEYSPDFIYALRIYDWPGNVRELVNEIHGAIFRAGEKQVLDIFTLSMTIRANYLVNQKHDLPKKESEVYFDTEKH